MTCPNFEILLDYADDKLQPQDAAAVKAHLATGCDACSTAWWVGGSPHVPDIRPVLEATSTLTAATGILNVWANEPADTATQDAGLRAEFPGRFMLGIGIGHPEATSDYKRPLTAMRAFLDGLDGAPAPPPVEERCLAALRPKMLELARERSVGAHT